MKTKKKGRIELLYQMTLILLVLLVIAILWSKIFPAMISVYILIAFSATLIASYLCYRFISRGDRIRADLKPLLSAGATRYYRRVIRPIHKEVEERHGFDSNRETFFQIWIDHCERRFYKGTFRYATTLKCYQELVFVTDLLFFLGGRSEGELKAVCEFIMGKLEVATKLDPTKIYQLIRFKYEEDNRELLGGESSKSNVPARNPVFDGTSDHFLRETGFSAREIAEAFTQAMKNDKLLLWPFRLTTDGLRFECSGPAWEVVAFLDAVDLKRSLRRLRVELFVVLTLEKKDYTLSTLSSNHGHGVNVDNVDRRLKSYAPVVASLLAK